VIELKKTMLKIPFGIYEGREIKKPERFDLIRSEEDRKQALVVFASFVQRAGVKIIEIDGETEDGRGWLLAGYGLSGKTPTIDQLNKIKDDNSRVLVSVWWDNAKKSLYSYDGWKFTGAILAVIQKNSNYEPVVKELPEVETIYQKQFDPEPDKNERYDRLLRQRTTTSSSLPLSKKTKPKKDKERVKKILKNRSFLTKIADWAIGITEDDLKKTVSSSSQSSEIHNHREESSDDGSDGYSSRRQDKHSRSHKHQAYSSSSSDLRTLPNNFD